MPFDGPRVPPPPRPKTTTDIVSDHEREKRRTQRPVANRVTARRTGGSFQATAAVPAEVAVPLPQGCEEVIVWSSFTATDPGAGSVIIGAGADEFSYGTVYVEGAGAPPYVWPNDGRRRTHTVHADIRDSDGASVAGFVTVTAFIR